MFRKVLFFGKKNDKKFVEQLSQRIPLGRMAKPYEFNGAIVYLCSNASSFVTGHNLVVDGGRTIWWANYNFKIKFFLLINNAYSK